MDRYKKNESVVNTLAAAYKKDTDVVRDYIHKLIDEGVAKVDFATVNKMWKGHTQVLGRVHEGDNDGIPCLDKQAYKPGGGRLWRRMSMQTFIKTYPRGKYIVRLEDEMILVENRVARVGDFTSKSRVIEAFKFEKL